MLVRVGPLRGPEAPKRIDYVGTVGEQHPSPRKSCGERVCAGDEPETLGEQGEERGWEEDGRAQRPGNPRLPSRQRPQG